MCARLAVIGSIHIWRYHKAVLFKIRLKTRAARRQIGFNCWLSLQVIQGHPGLEALTLKYWHHQLESEASSLAYGATYSVIPEEGTIVTSFPTQTSMTTGRQEPEGRKGNATHSLAAALAPFTFTGPARQSQPVYSTYPVRDST